jgi:hypothetical protein
MKFRPVELAAEPATMSGVRDRTTKVLQTRAAQERVRRARNVGLSWRDSNIHRRLNGIAAAKPNPRRPRKMLGSESLVER